MGFKIEIKHPNYYDKGEAQIILGLRLSDTPSMITNEFIETENVAVQFNAVYEIAETDDAYTFGWNDEGEHLFTQDDIKVGLNEVRSRKGRAVFLSFPTNFEGVSETLFSAGFKNSGILHDYYEDGIHDQHYTYTF